MNSCSTSGVTIGEEKNKTLSICSFEIGETTMCSEMPTVQAALTSATFLQSACCDSCPSVYALYEPEFIPLHMTWVLVEDAKGNCRAHMRWEGDR
jgi:hypothetical protein